VVENKQENEEDVVEMVYVKHEEEILKILQKYPNGLTRKDIGKKLDLSPATLWPHLKRLEEKGQCVIKQTIVNSHVTNMYYPQSEETIKMEDPAPDDVIREFENKPGIPVTAPLLKHPLADWNELKNRLIKDGDCGTALKIMVEMEEEANL